MTEMLTEIEVTGLWKQIAQSGTVFSTVQNQPVRVVYPGRPSDVPGADFTDAVLDIAGQVVRGNIEIHVRTSDWRKHRHHRDNAYNHNILHVVMQNDAEALTPLANGSRIPVVSIGDQSTPAVKLRKVKAIPFCRTRNSFDIGTNNATEILDRAGNARFREKLLIYRHKLEYIRAPQCLYEGIMVALGYSRNSEACHRLAEKLPLSSLEAVLNGDGKELFAVRLEALLLGKAGFLSSRIQSPVSSCDDEWLKALEKEWASCGHQPALTCQDWHLFRVRPGNHPARRLAGMAHLLINFREAGLMAAVFELLEQASGRTGWHYLEDGITIAAEGYWIDHFAPGKFCRELDRYLIGKSRAVEIINNVLLPFAAAYGEVHANAEITEKAFAIFQEYALAPDNTITRHMACQLGLKRSQVNSARRQQGLLHLYKRFCTQGRCEECPLK